MGGSASVAPAAVPFHATARFEVLAQVGQGGVGFVYEALDRERNAKVALKTLRAPDAQAILLLKHEFRAIQDLSHPNLVTPKELFEHEGQWFFTMDLVRGADFLSFVRPAGSEPGPPDDARLRSALSQLALGLSALHADHKVHRDVKPANVLVAPDGRVQILDFGIVSDLAQEPRADEEGQLVGTVLYMAPEQAGGVTVTPAADWYAVGVMLYQALTGRLPFVGTIDNVIVRKATEAPKPPVEVEPGTPSDLNELCVDLLQIDPEARPEGFQILQRLGVSRASVDSIATKQTGGFVGRRVELDAMEAAFEETRRGHPVVLLVEGESGVGKSRVVAEFTSRAASGSGALVFRGRCYERESLPYKAVDSLIDEMARYLAALPSATLDATLPEGAAALRTVFPALDTVAAIGEARVTRADALDPQEARAQMFALLRALFVNVAKLRRLVLVIDDLQWADADSLALLTEILRPPGGPPLLLLASIRSATERARGTSAHERLAQLPGDVRWVHLDPLPPGEARELIRSLLERGDASDAPLDVDAIHEEAKGHPLFIDELVRHRAMHATGTPARLDEALWERAQRLPPNALKLLEVVAVAGVPMPQSIVATAAALDLGQAFDSVTALRSAHFVRTSGVYRHDTVEAYHDRIRESVLAHLDGSKRKAWHGRLALALEQGGAKDPEKLIAHWVGAGENLRAAEYAILAAATAAEGLAFDHAASLYRQAIELGEPKGDAAVALKVKLAEALTNAARGADAAAVYLEAAGDEPSTRALDLRRRAGEQLVCSGRINLLSLLYSMLWLKLHGFAFESRREQDLDPRAVLRVDCIGSAGPGLGMSDHVRGRVFQVRALVEALKLGEPRRVARALAYHGLSVAGSGAPGFADAMKAQKIVETMASELRSPYLEAMACGVTAFAQYLVGEVAKSREPFERTEAIFRDQCVGVTHEIASVRMLLYRALVLLGDLPTLARLVDVTLHEAVQKGDLYTVVNLRTNCTSILALARDDVAAAKRELELAARHLPKHGFHVQHAYWHLAQTQVSLYAGEAAKGRDALAGQWSAIKRSMILRIQTMRVALHDARARCCIALLAVEPTADARREAERLIRAIEGEGLPWTNAHGDLLRACLAAVDGDRKGAELRLSKAEQAFDALDLALSAAVARRCRGAITGGEDGRALVASSEAWMAQQGVRDPAKLSALYAPGFARAIATERA